MSSSCQPKSCYPSCPLCVESCNPEYLQGALLYHTLPLISAFISLIQKEEVSLISLTFFLNLSSHQSLTLFYTLLSLPQLILSPIVIFTLALESDKVHGSKELLILLMVVAPKLGKVFGIGRLSKYLLYEVR